MEALEKKYQVFVSSTYEDLREERQEIMQALLELDCIPSGMELFPASDDDQWTLIKRVISDCDYYIVVVAGRYGSVGPMGLSYTEVEYRYAVEIGKPIVGFLHKNPSEIAAKKIEQTDDGKAKLEKFRKLVQSKTCKTWDSAKELGSVVSRSLVKLQKSHPSIGWVRGDQVPTRGDAREILKLTAKIEELQKQLTETRTEAPQGTEDLAQGDDSFFVRVDYSAQSKKTGGKSTWNDKIEITWNEVFSVLSPSMMNEASTNELLIKFNSFVMLKTKEEIRNHSESAKYEKYQEFHIDRTDFETVLVQMNALGLVSQSLKTRSLKDRGNYWTLTPYGHSVMTRLRAVHRQI